MYEIKYSREAVENLRDLKKSGNVLKLKKIKSALDKIQQDPRHPGLHTHKYQSFSTYDGEDVFQSYVENRTSGAFRIFWHYGKGKDVITMIAITPHP